MPPITPRSIDSPSSWPTICLRPAPIERRTATSVDRARRARQQQIRHVRAANQQDDRRHAEQQRKRTAAPAPASGSALERRARVASPSSPNCARTSRASCPAPAGDRPRRIDRYCPLNVARACFDRKPGLNRVKRHAEYERRSSSPFQRGTIASRIEIGTQFSGRSPSVVP